MTDTVSTPPAPPAAAAAPGDTIPAARRATVRRETKETQIRVTVDLDGTGSAQVATGVGFFDHMLDQLSRHGLIDLIVEATGDRHIDDHHTVEDVGITLGQAVARALGDRRGIRRYGEALAPMDETLSRVAIDISGRPFLVWRVAFEKEKIGSFDTDLVREFAQALAINAGMTLHVETFYGVNAHHIAESVFKALARALRAAVEPDPRRPHAVPSTKGSL
ncbi:MAG: imidazoleglycerol-phosphate dehydratase HisB [Rhodospirillaceae bacterium]|nr:imidazoleglycerol-phosphate dehydratase HisB [Rhodospirillaceae bacterium]